MWSNNSEYALLFPSRDTLRIAMDGMMNKHALHSHDLTAQLNSQQHVLKCCLNDRLTNVIEDQTREDHDKNKYKMLL